MAVEVEVEVKVEVKIEAQVDCGERDGRGQQEWE